MLICLDIDGTILSRTNEIGKYTMRIIKEYKDSHRILLCSARKPSAIKTILQQLNINEKIIICFNGALIMEGENTIYETPITTDNVEYLFKIAQKYQVSINVYSNDLWLVDRIDKYVLREKEIICEEPQIIEKPENNIPIHKILFLGTEEEIIKIENELKYIEGLMCVKSKKGYLEVTHYCANKKNAFLFLLEYLQCDIKNTLAIGDGYNDVELLKSAQIGIAMGNAPYEVKKVADYVTYSNDEDGVGYALKKILL